MAAILISVEIIKLGKICLAIGEESIYGADKTVKEASCGQQDSQDNGQS